MQVNVAGIRRNIKNLAHNYSDAQVKVREATSNDPWGPSATIMAEVADLTYNVVAFSEIMQMIWKRLNDHGKNWRHVYKALILLEYLIKTGTEKVAQQCKENIFAIQTLREFVYFEEGKDQGTHVREKAKQLVNLLKDDERLKNERIKALKAKERFAQHASGFGSDGYIEGPTHRDTPPGWQEEPKPVSDLELVRPQTAGEEELQLQLAMAMSREEAEQEEAKRRSDDVRLQLALSQSENDFKQPPSSVERKKEEPQSHLLDLLDISLGATSISSPPPLLGAAGGPDPWGTPARAASQLSDPWSGTSSPQIDPWQPAALKTATMVPSEEAWLSQRTQSPSVASGSSNEGWLHNNILSNGAVNGNSSSSTTDPWLSKSTTAATATAPAIGLTSSSLQNNTTDPWITDGVKLGQSEKSATIDDPWAPKRQTPNNLDPWKTSTTTGNVQKTSPDLDEFDIITNRNKTGNQMNNTTISGSNNNIVTASLLDEMDPLATKKPLKTPQAFLGENSALVNLDNLIKPIVPQNNTVGSAAYNPFSDTIPPKTNLFQQQQPAVPSINQLKQQQPFTINLNQDPWAPVNNSTATASAQHHEYLIDYDSDRITICTNNNKYSSQFDVFDTDNSIFDLNNDNSACNHNTNSSSNFLSDCNDYNVMHYENNHNNNNNTNDNCYYKTNNNSNSTYGILNSLSVQDFATSSTTALSDGYNLNNYFSLNNNNNNNTTTDSYSNNYNSISHSNSYGFENFNNKFSSSSSSSTATDFNRSFNPDFNSMNCSNLFSYGFFDSNKYDDGNKNITLRNYQKDNNNTAMPWIKPEAAASNPFLS